MLDLSDILLLVPPVVFFYLYTKKGNGYDILNLFLLSGSLAIVFKLLFRIPRWTGLDPFSFPSIHTAFASSLFFALPNVITLLFAASVGFLRVLEGYHDPIDVIGGFLTAGLSWLLYLGLKERVPHETERKTLHFSIAVIVGYFGLFLNQVLLSGVVFLLALLAYLFRTSPLLSRFYSRYSRSCGDIGPVTLSFSLFLSSFFGIMPLTAFMIAFVDGLAAVVGKIYGRHPVPWNKEKTLEGFLGGVAGAVIASILLRGFYSVDLLVISTIVAPFLETIKGIDDNLLVGVGLILVCLLSGGCPS